MSDLPKHVEIHEEGPREGFQIEPGPIPTADKIKLIEALSETGLHHIQACSFVNPRLVPGGFVGVDIFFVISGFIVSRSFSTARARSFIDFVVHFYARRLARIVPALVVCLLFSTLATVLFIPYAYLSGTSQRTGLAAFFGFSNFVLADFKQNFNGVQIESAKFVPGTMDDKELDRVT